MQTQVIEYLPDVSGDPSFFVNPSREFLDFPSHGHKGIKIVRNGLKVLSRESVVYDKDKGWIPR